MPGIWTSHSPLLEFCKLLQVLPFHGPPFPSRSTFPPPLASYDLPPPSIDSPHAPATSFHCEPSPPQCMHLPPIGSPLDPLPFLNLPGITPDFQPRGHGQPHWTD